MEEARRFMRYVIPGIFFTFAFGFFLLLARPDLCKPVCKALSEKDAGLVFLASGILGSGVIGSFLSGLHHWWRWRSFVTTMDHRGSIQRLVEKDLLRVAGIDGKELSVEEMKALGRADAWIITTALWHQLLKINKRIGGSDPGMKEMMDQVHSLGTSRVAAFCAPLASVIAAFWIPPQNTTLFESCRIVFLWLWGVIIAVLIFRMLHSNYIRTARFAQRLIDQIVADALAEEKGKNPLGVTIWPAEFDREE